jgi:hypothetical protein
MVNGGGEYVEHRVLLLDGAEYSIDHEPGEGVLGRHPIDL